MTRSAIVVGAGIGGLSAALALGCVGIDVKIFEKVHELKEIGAGIILYPNALNALRRIDVFDQVAKEGSFARSGKYFDSTGKVLVELDFAGRNSLESLAIHRADLQRVLAERVGKDRIQLGKSCCHIEAGDRVRAEFTDGTVEDADILIGADGAHSVVRAKLLAREGPARYSKCFAFRGVTSLSDSAMPPNFGFMALAAGLQFGGMQIGKGRTYWYGAVLDPEGMRNRTGKKHALQIFGKWGSPIPELIESTPEESILCHDLFDRNPSKVWGKGSVTLLGDAAHPMTPFMGQGGCQALEDSVALGAALKQEAEIVRALRLYEARRMKRTSDFVMQSRRAMEFSMTRSPILSGLRNSVLSILPGAFLIEQLHTLSRYDLPSLD